MRMYVALFLALGILVSCDKPDDSPQNETTNFLIGNWKLIEVLADPGDGSGTFVPVESTKTVTFNEDGTISSNGSLCDLSISTSENSSGTYSISDSTYSSNDCFNPEYNYPFEQDGNNLIISYPCFEPCKSKFEKE